MPRRYDANGNLTPRFETRFPVPPVCTAYWTEDDWGRWVEKHGVTVDTEPDVLRSPIFEETHVFVKTGERSPNGEMLYRYSCKACLGEGIVEPIETLTPCPACKGEGK